jgi:hypothetical protein
MSDSEETEDASKNTAWELLSPNVRKVIYLIFAFISAIVSAVGAGVAAAHGLFPEGIGLYIAFASAFLNAFGTAIGITALMNTPSTKKTTETRAATVTVTPVVETTEAAEPSGEEPSK